MTAAQRLRRAEAAQQAAFARWQKAMADRDEVIRRALAEGMTHAQVARATGLTRGRIGQLAAR